MASWKAASGQVKPQTAADLNRVQPLTVIEHKTYEWQMWVAVFGEEGQRLLKGVSVLVSRCGGGDRAVSLIKQANSNLTRQTERSI
jgi:hypothetical protein